MLNALNSRFRAIVSMTLAAILVAAFLRHTLHVYGGISREAIRADAILLIAGVTIVAMLLKILRTR